MSFKRLEKPVYESNSGRRHPDYESRNTRVSEYLRKYGTGRIDEMPRDTRNEVVDNRTVDEMLNDEFVPSLGTDELDAMIELEKNAERFEKARKLVELTQKQKVKFDNAVKVLNDHNASKEAKEDALNILEELERAGKISRARD